MTGAGASVEYGIPATIGFGKLIDEKIWADKWCSHTGAIDAYCDIKDKLQAFYGNAADAHFERVYHVMHELAELREKKGAVTKFLPVLFPFLGGAVRYSSEALEAACKTMLEFIYTKVSEVCERPERPLNTLTAFFEGLEKDYIPRVYTTNYDDFVGQATEDRYFTGFSTRHHDHFDFDAVQFWSSWDRPALFHLHGSVHMGFPMPGEHNIGDICWFDDRADALRHAGFTGSGLTRMDGTSLERGAIITGLDKLGRLQQSPYAFYYSALNKEAMEADVIIVLGSGLADLHLNTFIRAARRARPNVPILYVGYWGGDAIDFYNAINFDPNDREISLLHDLGVNLNRLPERQFGAHDRWTIGADRKSAVWSLGFQSFLNDLDAFNAVMATISAP